MNYKKVFHFSRNRNSLIYSALSIGIIAVLLGFVIQHNKVPERVKIKRTLQDSCPWLTPSELSKLIETNNYPSLIKVLRLKHGQFFSKVEIVSSQSLNPVSASTIVGKSVTLAICSAL